MLLVLALAVALALPGLGWAATPVPPPPTQNIYVYDQANLIDPAQREQMLAIGEKINAATKAQVVVATVDTIGQDPIEDYALELFRQWGIGDRQKNNGVLLLIVKDRMLSGQSGKVRIEVGSGLEGAIPDGKAGRIL
ncbi:MAG: TPM domain-containing protein, partial [Clostridia bacterium]|nr:TPM domain-containing protein [Clostridia bacterium]